MALAEGSSQRYFWYHDIICASYCPMLRLKASPLVVCTHILSLLLIHTVFAEHVLWNCTMDNSCEPILIRIHADTRVAMTDVDLVISKIHILRAINQ